MFAKTSIKNIAQKFYTKWESIILADAGTYVSKKIPQFLDGFNPINIQVCNCCWRRGRIFAQRILQPLLLYREEW